MGRTLWVVAAAAVIGAGLAGLAGAAEADSLIPTLESVTPSGPGFSWTWTVDLTNDEVIDTGLNPAFTTVYDVPGLAGTPACTAAAGLSCAVTVQDTGVTAPHTAPPDDPASPNVTVHWTGTSGPGPETVGTLTLVDANGGQGLTAFSSEATKYAPGTPEDGTPASNLGSVTAPSPVPEPSSLVLLGAALLGSAPLLRGRLGRTAGDA